MGGGGRDQALDRAVADGAFFLVRGAEALDFLKLMAAIFAAVFVKGHWFLWGFDACSILTVHSPQRTQGHRGRKGKPVPQRLKPDSILTGYGPTEVGPFQSVDAEVGGSA